MTTAFKKAARYVDQELVNPLRAGNLIRKLLPLNTRIAGRGIKNVDYYSITEMSDAMITYDIDTGEASTDNINVSVTNIAIPVIKKHFKIPRRDFDAFENQGIPFDTAAALSAGAMVTKAENSLGVQGWKRDGSAYQINGLYQAAGNTTAGSSFGTFGGALTSIADALALFDADNVFADSWNLTLNSVQRRELQKSVSTGIVEEELVRKVLGPQGDIFVSNDLVAGTGLLTPVDTSGQYFDLINPDGPKTVIGEDSKLPEYSDLFGTVIDFVVPRIKQTNAICTLTVI
jgi:uncharacterized linocin/CFP29 family protein